MSRPKGSKNLKTIMRQRPGEPEVRRKRKAPAPKWIVQVSDERAIILGSIYAFRDYVGQVAEGASLSQAANNAQRHYFYDMRRFRKAKELAEELDRDIAKTSSEII